MPLDQAEFLTPTEKQLYEAWQAKHTKSCAGTPKFMVSSAISGYGFRMRALCLGCGMREDVTDKSGRDPIPVK